VTKEELSKIYNWYYSPEETLRSIGFYINPYKQWKWAKFRHIFAFDAKCNLYVGQYSVYKEHFKSIFDLEDKREHGFLYPKSTSIKPHYSEEETQAFNIDSEEGKQGEIIMFEFMEYKNITYLNIRLKKMAQRLYDYGVSPDAVVVSKQVDLWEPTINSILNGRFMIRPEKKWIKSLLA
jgi:hypothetical protein